MQKKRIVYINLGNYGSTGKIVDGLSKLAKDKGYDVLKCYPGNDIKKKKEPDDYVICSCIMKKINHRIAMYTGLLGCVSVLSTVRLIKKIKEFNPDIIHLHNLHGDFINLPILFNYIKRSNKKIVWTLHDCWAFTGRCPFFQVSGCEKWKEGCAHCPFPRKTYPECCLDTSKAIWNLKRRIFTGVPNLKLVTPSRWLAELVTESFLKEYQTEVIYNGIDLTVFKSTPSDFKDKYGISERIIVLGVAFNWNKYKGLDVFIELRKVLSEKYCIVLVGTDEEIDSILPEGIISIHRTSSQRELAEIYTAADVFVNPTREEVLGLTNIEALACGTPVITFNTGGSPECIDIHSGYVINGKSADFLNELRKKIENICEAKTRERVQCLKRATIFDGKEKYLQYIELYERLQQKQ